MAKIILIITLLSSFYAHADLFDFNSESGSKSSKVPELMTKLKKLEMKEDSSFEEAFNQGVKDIENSVEEEKLYCSGEAQDSEGKTLPVAQKQLCMRELKKHYIQATSTIFDLKKKYLEFIHQRQLEKLTEIQKKLRADLEKNF